jgi:hypothetical protein
MLILENPVHQKQLDDGIANMSISEVYSRIAVLRKMIGDERLCRRKMVVQQPENWGTIQQSSFKELQNVCRTCINVMNQAIEQRFEGQAVSGKEGA